MPSDVIAAVEGSCLGTSAVSDNGHLAPFSAAEHSRADFSIRSAIKCEAASTTKPDDARRSSQQIPV